MVYSEDHMQNFIEAKISTLSAKIDSSLKKTYLERTNAINRGDHTQAAISTAREEALSITAQFFDVIEPRIDILSRLHELVAFGADMASVGSIPRSMRHAANRARIVRRSLRNAVIEGRKVRESLKMPPVSGHSNHQQTSQPPHQLTHV